MVAPVVAAAYVVLAFLLRVLLYVLKKLLNQAAKVTTDIVKKHLAPFLADIGASIAQNLIEFIFLLRQKLQPILKKNNEVQQHPSQVVQLNLLHLQDHQMSVLGMRFTPRNRFYLNQ